MNQRVITADQVREASGRLVVPSGAILTPLARDVAADLGVALVPEGTAPASPEAAPAGSAPPHPVQPAGEVSDELTRRIRDIVTTILGGSSTHPPTPPRRPVKLCRAEEAVTEPFTHPGPGPGQQVRTGDVVTSADGSPMGAGYMTLTAGTFPWRFDYDEIQIVLEGELHLGTPDGVRIARPGDVMYVPKGSEVTFSTPAWARFVYVTFPADWEQGL